MGSNHTLNDCQSLHQSIPLTKYRRDKGILLSSGSTWPSTCHDSHNQSHIRPRGNKCSARETRGIPHAVTMYQEEDTTYSTSVTFLPSHLLAFYFIVLYWYNYILWYLVSIFQDPTVPHAMRWKLFGRDKGIVKIVSSHDLLSFTLCRTIMVEDVD